ncbi:hypothetical protein LCGC14_1589520, partial [marine sediment metagenome]
MSRFEQYVISYEDRDDLHISRWLLEGVNTKPSGSTYRGWLFMQASKAGDTATVDLYKDPACASGDKVATGSADVSGVGSAPVKLTLSEANSSGLSGSLYFEGYSSDPSSAVAVLVAFVICFAFAKPIYNFLLWPYRVAVGGDMRIEMIYTAPQEFFFTEVKLALFGAIFIAFPVIASQIYMFVAPGLYRNERRAFLPFLIATPILFLIGASLVYFVAMPLAMTFFLSMQ